MAHLTKNLSRLESGFIGQIAWGRSEAEVGGNTLSKLRATSTREW
jgi:hypothetical protein